jgi:hypothetical protein
LRSRITIFLNIAWPSADNLRASIFSMRDV